MISNGFWMDGTGSLQRAKVLFMRLILICLLLLCGRASAQIMLRINDAAPVNIAAKDLAQLPRHAAVLNEHGKQIGYEGALMHDVLALGSIDFGKGIRGKQLSTYVAALASDGYEVVYALAEFDPDGHGFGYHSRGQARRTNPSCQ